MASTINDGFQLAIQRMEAEKVVRDNFRERAQSVAHTLRDITPQEFSVFLRFVHDAFFMLRR